MKTSAKKTPARGKKPAVTSRGASARTETIAASVPAILVKRVRERIRGHGDFSQFVARSMERELVRLARKDFVADVIRETGSPLDPDSVAVARRLIRH